MSKSGDNRSILRDLDENEKDARRIVIDKKDIKPINDTKCKHEWALDPTENEEFWYGIKCKNCIIGKLIKKSTGQDLYKSLGGR